MCLSTHSHIAVVLSHVTVLGAVKCVGNSNYLNICVTASVAIPRCKGGRKEAEFRAKLKESVQSMGDKGGGGVENGHVRGDIRKR